MKLGTQTRAAAFLVYEYKNVKNFGKIIKLNDEGEMRYFVFEDEINNGQNITVVYNDINMIVFHNAYNSVEDLSTKWREFNRGYNPEVYTEHLNKLVELQKDHFQKSNTTIEINDFINIK